MERVAPKQLNYDDVLPLAIESRSNRRTFAPSNGSTFSNNSGSTIIRIDVNADSMLDAAHSYLSVDFTVPAAAAASLCPEIGPAWIQRLRIESGGVTIEDINEYGRLYAAMMLNQCPEDYVNNVCGNQGLYRKHQVSGYRQPATAPSKSVSPGQGNGVSVVGGPAVTVHNADADADLVATIGAAGAIALSNGAQALGTQGTVITFSKNAVQSGGTMIDNEIAYVSTPQTINRGKLNTGFSAASAAGNQVLAHGIPIWEQTAGIGSGKTVRMNIPLMSGFLNMDKYLPLIMMNAGFTIELHLAPNTQVGVPVEVAAAANDNIPDVCPANLYEISSVHYVAHLIDLDREFYGKLRSVMEGSGGVLQLAGQTYRHYSGILAAGATSQTITLPARVKSVKSIFATFCASDQRNKHSNFNTSVFQTGGIKSWRFEIGSVRYPQTDIKFHSTTNIAEVQSELHKAFGKLGDYSHSSCVKPKHLHNAAEMRVPLADNVGATGAPQHYSLLSGFMLGYDFEAFQKVALESGINTADRSLPINFVCEKDATNAAPLGNVAAHNAIATGAAEVAAPMTADFYVLSDAIYYINLDGTVSVSV